MRTPNPEAAQGTPPGPGGATIGAGRGPAVRGRATRLVFSALVLVPLALVPGGCDDEGPSPRRGQTISKEAFIGTMVELRREALRRDGGRLPPAERARILRERDVTAQELLRFAEVHGRNVPFMHEVWTEVDRRLTEGEAGEEEQDERPTAPAPIPDDRPAPRTIPDRPPG